MNPALDLPGQIEFAYFQENGTECESFRIERPNPQ
jgi:hypothetical protein